MCQFFLDALLEFDLASLEVVAAEPSVNPRFFFLLSLINSSWASRKLFPSVLFYSLFFPASIFFEAVLDFTISPNASVRALGLNNLIHSTDPPPETLFLSNPPSLLPLMFSAPVLLSYSSSSSELSNYSDNNDWPLWPNEAFSSLSLAL